MPSFDETPKAVERNITWIYIICSCAGPDVATNLIQASSLPDVLTIRTFAWSENKAIYFTA